MRRPLLAPTVIACSLAVFAGAPAIATASAASARPPDLRLEWSVAGRVTGATAEPVRGRRGETVDVSYRLRNVGGTDAFAAILEARTALGPAADRERLQPGPAAGAAIDRTLALALATGMRELCIDARLQTVEPEDAGDANPRDNRICRKVEIEAGSGAGGSL